MPTKLVSGAGRYPAFSHLATGVSKRFHFPDVKATGFGLIPTCAHKTLFRFPAATADHAANRGRWQAAKSLAIQLRTARLHERPHDGHREL